MLPMRSFLLTILAPVALAGAFACQQSGALPEPKSDNQADDPCDPGSSGGQTGSTPPVDAGATPLELPGGSAGIGFDDMTYSAGLAQVLVPAGRTGDVDLVAPSTEAVTSVTGFSTSASYGGDTSFGVTSAIEGNDVIYATDRTSKTLAAVDPATRKITETFTLASTPGYVRYVAATQEVWVTEPAAAQIEVVAVHAPDGGPGLAQVGTIAVDGAESLELDGTSGTAFTNSPKSTIALDVTTHKIANTWPNGCTTARGLAVDPMNGWVIVGCNEGRLVVLSETSGSMLGAVSLGAGVDRLAYDASRTRAYVPIPSSPGAMGVIVLSAKGVPTIAGSVEAPDGAHCAVAPGGGEVFVCAPAKGQLVYLFDPF
jgi:hypothetical protein